ncbi:MAG: sugar-binding protein [Sedimentisphaeraceae bacterium JB056]
MYKTIKSIFIIILGVCAIAAAVDYQVPLTFTAPVVDGNSLPGEWDGSLDVSIAYPGIVSAGGADITGSSPAASDCSADVKMLWDADNLYVYVRVYDEDMTFSKNYPGPYNGQDCFQVAFNLLDNSEAIFLEDAPIYDFSANTADEVGASVAIHGIFNVDNLTVAGKEFEDGWQMEIAIPWNTYQHFAHPGDRHGLGLLLVDYDGDSPVENFLTDYGNGENTIDDITTWNTITLIGENGCGTNGRFIGDLNGDCNVDISDIASIASQWAQSTL